MAANPSMLDWKADAVEWALKVVLAPLWVPAMILEDMRLHARTRRLVRCRVADAWERSAAVWRERGLVFQWSAHDGAAFGHELAVALARRHHSKRVFFLARVADPDPLLAAFAFKCLIRTGRVRREDLPAGALQRTDTISVLWADLGDVQPLGEYLEGWFRQQERIGQRS